MRRGAIVLALAIAVLVVLFAVTRRQSIPAPAAQSTAPAEIAPSSPATPAPDSPIAPPPTASLPAATPAFVAAVVPPPDIAPTPLANASPDAAASPSPTPAFPGPPPLVRLESVRTKLSQYGAAFGGNPVGTNAEITAALNGDNPRHARFLDGADGNTVNSAGELVDVWGTPYFFHQLSAKDTEVRSAGPDKRMYTPDDLLIR